MSGSPDIKHLGAYYTPPGVVRALVDWATRGKSDPDVLDPSCGDGRFLEGLRRGVGIDIDSSAVSTASSRCEQAKILKADFFDWAKRTERRFDAVVGNPPFIRYQRFNGRARQNAQEYCESQGVKLSGLSSSWAPFIVGAASRLKSGGRLAFVVPAEIGHAVYARPIVKYLLRSFDRVEVFAIREKLFPQLSEDCWLLRASGYGGNREKVVFHSADRFRGARTEWVVEHATGAELAEHLHRLRPFLLPSNIRSLYRHLSKAEGVQKLGEVAQLGIGYVTGSNDFFHLRPSQAESARIPLSLLRPAVRANRDLAGTDITSNVVASWLSEDRPLLLLDLSDVEELPDSVVRYLDSPEGQRVRQRYKCRARKLWYRVPDVRAPDAFLSIMSSSGPRFVGNSARCVCTNSVHAVTVKQDVKISKLVEAWGHALTQLSCEIEGHPLGGGMLKVEPKEARRITVPLAKTLAAPDVDLLTEGIGTMRKWRHCA